MEIKEDIDSFFESNAFQLIEQKTSKYFGDYYFIYSNNVIELRFSNSKSFKNIDVRSIEEEKNWYDLALLKILLYQEKELNKTATIGELIGFLKINLNQIIILLNRQNYAVTKKQLESIEVQRVKQIFPRIE